MRLVMIKHGKKAMILLDSSPRRLTCDYLTGFDSVCYPKKAFDLKSKS